MRKQLTHDAAIVASTAYFDFRAPEPEIRPRQGTDPLRRVMEACQAWVDAGNLIEPYGLGVGPDNCKRDESGEVHATYRAIGEKCDPLGVILNGNPCNFMYVADAARVLGVDEFWIVGFLHSIDSITVSVIGKQLENLQKSASYVAGRDAGRIVKAKFIKERERIWQN